MQSASHVLIYGKDADLLETRRLVLDKAGFVVRAAIQFDDFQAAGDSETPDVVLLCHTLNTEECDEALSTAEMRWPQARRLVLTAGDRGCWRPQSTVALDATDGPRKLIRAVANLARDCGGFYPQTV